MRGGCYVGHVDLPKLQRLDRGARRGVRPVAVALHAVALYLVRHHHDSLDLVLPNHPPVRDEAVGHGALRGDVGLLPAIPINPVGVDIRRVRVAVVEVKHHPRVVVRHDVAIPVLEAVGLSHRQRRRLVPPNHPHLLVCHGVPAECAVRVEHTHLALDCVVLIRQELRRLLRVALRHLPHSVVGLVFDHLGTEPRFVGLISVVGSLRLRRHLHHRHTGRFGHGRAKHRAARRPRSRQPPPGPPVRHRRKLGVGLGPSLAPVVAIVAVAIFGGCCRCRRCGRPRIHGDGW
mmetsp:Transcript_18876/g.49140  ORF Transcript_18876/g.49140 Transcript_18876/m.49140 type:complete len:289 (+) Transcript_18876:803-1669(+)